MKIGFFDSGIGGISVLHQAMKALPDAEFLYYADTRHVPYGKRTREEIREYTEDAVRFMLDKGVCAIVVACNTATSAAIEYLRAHYSLPLLGMEPAVKPAVRLCGEGRILVAATPFTIHEEKLHHLVDLVDSHHQVDLLPLPELVVFAERGEFESEAVETYLKKELSRLQLSQYSAFVLGCTHFGYFRRTLRELLGPTVRFLDGNEGTVHHLVEVLKERHLLESGQGGVTYYRSGEEVTDPQTLIFYEKLHEQLEGSRL